MNCVIITQARMTSTRLPGKVLKKINSQTMLAWHLNQLLASKLANQVVLATTDKHTDDPLITAINPFPVQTFRGSEQDVLARYLGAAQQAQANIIVRVTSDCPLIDPNLLDACIQKQIDTQADYVSNIDPRTYPRGLDVEVFTMKALETAAQAATHASDREHVTPYIRNHPEQFRQTNIQQSNSYLRLNNQKIPLADLRWTLDTPEDFEFLEKLMENLDLKKTHTWQNVLAHLEKSPEWITLNQHIKQKTA